MPEVKVCVLDAGPIIHLDQLGVLRLLMELGQVVVTETVAAEAAKHRPALDIRSQFTVFGDVESIPMRVAFAASRHSLDPGELTALAWGEVFGADMFVSDDGKARLAAKELGYEITGTIGVILHASQQGTLTKPGAIALLERIPTESTLHISTDFLSETVARLR